MMPTPNIGDRITFRNPNNGLRFAQILAKRGAHTWEAVETSDSLRPGRIHRIQLKQIEAINGWAP